MEDSKDPSAPPPGGGDETNLKKKTYICSLILLGLGGKKGMGEYLKIQVQPPNPPVIHNLGYKEGQACYL